MCRVRLAPALLGAAVLAVLAGGCRERPARNADEAYRRFVAAVTAGDAARLYQALDQPSRWSVISVQSYYRDIDELIARGYPPEARARELERIVGARARTPAAFFAVQNERHGWLKRLQGGMGATVRTTQQGATVSVCTDRGRCYELAAAGAADWGYAGLRAELEELKVRASHDLEMARENARIYQRAQGAGAAGPAQ